MIIVSILALIAIIGHRQMIVRQRVKNAARTIETIAKIAREYSNRHLVEGQYAEGDLDNTVAVNAQYGLQIPVYNNQHKEDPGYQYFEFTLRGTEIKAILQEDMWNLSANDELIYDLEDPTDDPWDGLLKNFR